MRVSDFYFKLPNYLIANYPMIHRSNCRLLTLDGLSGKIKHEIFTDILNKFNPGDILVFNNTRVIPAKIIGRKVSGGKIDILVERIIDNSRIIAHIRSSNTPKPGLILLLGNNDCIIKATVLYRYNESLFEIIFESNRTILDILNIIGCIPLPPYIKRDPQNIDYEMYQTIYGIRPGAIASPTAGLHFDQELMKALKQKGVKIVFITLHIGSGTFLPVRVEMVENHKMHPEYVEVPQDVVNAILICKKNGNKVVAVGTTSARSLESAAQTSSFGSLIEPFFNDTKMFIYPGYHYKIIDGLITNFHLPKSTLIMLVSAFAGYKYTMEAYHVAIAKKYRFFSYGDAMFITKNPKAPYEFN